MFKLTISGAVPNQTPEINGRTWHLRAGSVELIDDLDDVAALDAWIVKHRLWVTHRLEQIRVSVARPLRLSEAQALEVLGQTRRTTLAELVGRVEAAGFDVPEDVAALRTRSAMVQGLVALMTGG